MMSITKTFLMITDSEIIEEKPYCEGTDPYTAQNMNLQKVSFSVSPIKHITAHLSF